VHRFYVEKVGRPLETGKGAIAAPAPLGRIVAESRAYRIERDIAVCLQKMCIVRDVSRRKTARRTDALGARISN
jgi:hypothetical protein